MFESHGFIVEQEEPKARRLEAPGSPKGGKTDVAQRSMGQ